MKPLAAAALTAMLLLPAVGTASAGPIQDLGAIRAAAGAFLRARHSDVKPADLRVHVDALDPRLRLTRCSAPLHTFLSPGSRAVGNTTVGVRCAAPKPWTLYVPARVVLYRKVLVAARPLARGTHLRKADLRLARRDVEQLPYGYLTSIRSARGKLLLRLVPAGMALSPQMLASPALVHRGQQVVLLAETGGLQVRVSGLALGDGAAGAAVKVRNLASGRVIDGIVVRPGVVRVPM